MPEFTFIFAFKVLIECSNVWRNHSLNDNIKGTMYSFLPEETEWVWWGFSISHCFLIMLRKWIFNVMETTLHMERVCTVIFKTAFRAIHL